MPRLRTPLLLVLLVLVAAGCTKIDPEFVSNEQVAAEDRTQEAAAPAAPEAGGGGALEFVAVDIAWEAAPTTAPAGEVTLALNNQGASQHNVTIDGVGPGTLVEANGGQTAEETVTLEPGTYEYYCSVPGHTTLMRGQLTVQ